MDRALSERTWSRPNPEREGFVDRFYMITRRIKSGTKVTMYEIGWPLTGSLDKSVTVWTDPIAMLDAMDAVGKDLEADGWVRDFPTKRRRKRT